MQLVEWSGTSCDAGRSSAARWEELGRSLMRAAGLLVPLSLDTAAGLLEMAERRKRLGVLVSLAEGRYGPMPMEANPVTA